MTPISDTVTQAEKGRRFRTLHERQDAFIIPNPYDTGTALLLAHLGFEALATPVRDTPSLLGIATER